VPEFNAELQRLSGLNPSCVQGLSRPTFQNAFLVGADMGSNPIHSYNC